MMEAPKYEYEIHRNGEIIGNEKANRHRNRRVNTIIFSDKTIVQVGDVVVNTERGERFKISSIVDKISHVNSFNNLTAGRKAFKFVKM